MPGSSAPRAVCFGPSASAADWSLPKQLGSSSHFVLACTTPWHNPKGAHRLKKIGRPCSNTLPSWLDLVNVTSQSQWVSWLSRNSNWNLLHVWPALWPLHNTLSFEFELVKTHWLLTSHIHHCSSCSHPWSVFLGESYILQNCMICTLMLDFTTFSCLGSPTESILFV